MHWLLFLEMLLYQEAGGVYGINGATASYEAALIAGKLDDVPKSFNDNSARLPFFFQIGIVALWRQPSDTFFSATT
ncbi:unnamed protein product [Heligmosomoides polygyrus]|uniref:Secreted protein n=1 Tax=Heligmosomoides polygyrus TaxID=6339 RepID=A0A183GL17_HELPZ|nr:unnamed protein product [Heligmosomoides polygyrus]